MAWEQVIIQTENIKLDFYLIIKTNKDEFLKSNKYSRIFLCPFTTREGFLTRWEMENIKEKTVRVDNITIQNSYSSKNKTNIKITYRPGIDIYNTHSWQTVIIKNI